MFVCSLAFGSIVTRATNADRGTTHRDLGTHHSCLPSRFRTHTLAWLAAAAWGTRVCLLVCLCAQFRASVLSVCLSVCELPVQVSYVDLLFAALGSCYARERERGKNAFCSLTLREPSILFAPTCLSNSAQAETGTRRANFFSTLR